MALYPNISNQVNPYRDNVQGKANEPITVAGLLDRSKQTLGSEYEGPAPDWTLGEISQPIRRKCTSYCDYWRIF